jgi:hypothetical protein
MPVFFEACTGFPQMGVHVDYPGQKIKAFRIDVLIALRELAVRENACNPAVLAD